MCLRFLQRRENLSFPIEANTATARGEKEKGRIVAFPAVL